ncbi:MULTISPECIES: hypothetical protein [unclassified Streptomyces]|uniref:hypothetical protein n=1 Tax=Streptomyces sp. SID8377 TaxID=2690357 RepID=UPI0004761CCC|nr:hypothetical protein [Streptomyces sp. BoleA5]MYX35366.1 hypothetical protein [Streptomyces sp. SID8377]
MERVNATFGSAAAQLVPLAAKDLDENKVTPGLLGFVIFALIGFSLWWLMKNMNKQFKKIDFEEQPQRTEQSEPQSERAEAASAASGSEGPGSRKG